MQPLLWQTLHPTYSHLSTHISQCYFSKIKPKRLTASYQRSVPSLLKFAGLKEQAIGNPALPAELEVQADRDYGSDASLCNPKTAPGAADCPICLCYKRKDKIHSQNRGCSLLTSRPSLLATKRGANINQNRTFFSLKVSVNKTSTQRKAISRDCTSSCEVSCHTTLQHPNLGDDT